MKVKVTKKKQVVVEMVTIELPRKDAEALLEDILEGASTDDEMYPALNNLYSKLKEKIG